MLKSKSPAKQFSIRLPESLLEEIDTICAATYSSRTTWIMKAAQERLDRERLEREKKLQEKLREE